MHATEPGRPIRASRRDLLGLAAGVATWMTAPASAARTQGKKVMRQIAYVGCRTSRDRNARGDGIGVYAIGKDGLWTRVQLVGDLLNPSYLAFDRERQFLYTVHGDSSEASAFRIAPETGELTFLNRVTTGGRNPVHLAPDPTNRFMVIANHIVKDGVKSGIASLPMTPDGCLGEPADIVAFDGQIGPHRVEQPFPKPHQVEFDPEGRFIVVPDKGCDRVLSFTIDGVGKLHALPNVMVPARETSGPRHVAFHPRDRFAYVVNELDSTIAAYQVDPARCALHPFQIVSALPQGFTGNSRGSEIAVSRDGRFVYASNRGDDSLGIFAIDPATGLLSPRGWVPSGGRTPRFFAIGPDHKTLFVANEDGHSIVRYRLDQSSGLLHDAVRVAETGSPTCILFN
jgi:6-phosphogluconolactonase (cycloisomerase 2 family)